MIVILFFLNQQILWLDSYQSSNNIINSGLQSNLKSYCDDVPNREIEFLSPNFENEYSVVYYLSRIAELVSSTAVKVYIYQIFQNQLIDMTAVEILAASSGVLAGCLYFRDTLDPRRILNLPVKVNCWFCCHDAKVPYKSRTAWTCPRKECSQFNGFEVDGGYSKEIQEQHLDPDEFVGPRQIRYAQSLHSANNAYKTENQNVLCRTCNLNQDLKIHQLRTFIPRNEADYDREIEEFEAHLERTYRLCRYCEASLHQKLGEEDSWLRPKLLGWKLEKNRQSPLSSAKNIITSGNQSSKYLEKIVDVLLRLFLIIAALFASFTSTWELNHLCTLFNNSKGLFRTFRVNNIVLKKDFTTNEELLQALSINSKLLAINGFRQDIAIILVFILVLGKFWYARNAIYQSLPLKACLAGWILLVLETTFREQTTIEITPDVRSFLAIICITTSIIVSVFSSFEGMNKRSKQNIHHERKDRANQLEPHWEWNNQRIQESLVDDTLTQDLVSTSTPVGSVIAPNCLSVSQSSAQIPTLAPSRLNISNRSFGNSQTDSFSSGKDSNEKEIINGKQCDISTLQIGANKPTFLSPETKNIDTLSVVSGAFSLKRYDIVNRSGIDFGDLTSSHAPQKRPLIKPSKFTSGSQKGFAKSSWVAGGYWLNNKYQQNKLTRNIRGRSNDLPETLSNSSSQSSGFVSYSGQPFVSKNSSLFNSSKFHQLRSDPDNNVFTKFANDESNPLFQTDRTGKLSKDILPNDGISNYEHSFSLNPISEQLAFFDTTTSSKYGNSRPNSPLSQYNELKQPNLSRMSPNFTALHYKENGRDNKSFNSSLNGLTQEAFLELRPKAESSPVTNDKNSHNLKKKSWMEKKLTINVSVYSVILFSSVAANIALIIYFLL